MEKFTPKSPLTKMSLMHLNLRVCKYIRNEISQRLFCHILNILYIAQSPQY